MKYFVSVFFLFSSIFNSVSGQTTQQDPAIMLSQKGRVYVGLSTSGAGFAGRERRLVSVSFISPKIGYFFMDRFSVELALRGFGVGRGLNQKPVLLFNSDLGLNYFVYRKNNFLVNVMGGVSYGRLQPGFRSTTPNTAFIKAGTGVSWRFAKNPNFGLTLDAAYYLDPKTFRSSSILPTLSVGITYFFNRPKPKFIAPVE